MEKLRLLIAQQNPIVGDIQGNVQMAKAALNLAGKQKADLIVLSELFLSGYPPEDLLLNPSFIRDIAAGVEALARECDGVACLVGAPYVMEGKLFNAALLLEGGRVAQVATKRHLPNYGVFDEARLFAPGKGAQVMDFHGVCLGVLICEDVWQAPTVAKGLSEAAPDMMVVLNGSPFEQGKAAERLKHCAAHTAAFNAPLTYVNQVGGQDDLVFDGASFVLDSASEVIVSLPLWESENRLTVWEKSAGSAGGWSCAPQELELSVVIEPADDSSQEIYPALVLGVRDYVRKNNFTSVLLGLSGGIDSALVAAIACDALGAAQVHCLALPSRFSSKGSLEDARACAQALGARLDIVDIEPMMVAGLSALSPLFGDLPHDLAEENLQSRLRGLLLMAVSNKFGAMVLTTGNKSEMSVGYATLYGDMNGGFNPLKDVYKTEVFALARWRNQQGDKSDKGAVIPRAILEKPPSAELRADQKDEDSLPPYDKLDDILRKLIDEELSLDDIIALGHGREIVHHIDRLVRLAEYKRRQSAPGVRVGKRYFGKARRYPITNAYGRKNDG